MSSLGSNDRDGIPEIGIIGTGRAGTALALALRAAGYHVVAGWSRSRSAAGRFVKLIPGAIATDRPLGVLEAADVVFLTVPDDLIPVLAQALPWGTDKTAIHCSGALSLDVLEPAAAEGAGIGSLHPLLPLAADGQSSLSGATIAIEGDARTLPLLEAMAGRIGRSTMRLNPGDRRLYHVAATLLSNYTVTLFAAAVDLWARLGVPADEARASLLPLLEGVSRNLHDASPEEALTGPLARGDVATIKAHLDLLAQRAPEFLDLYRSLAMATLPLALEQGRIDDQQVTELRALLSAATRTEEAIV